MLFERNYKGAKIVVPDKCCCRKNWLLLIKGPFKSSILKRASSDESKLLPSIKRPRKGQYRKTLKQSLLTMNKINVLVYFEKILYVVSRRKIGH